MNDEHTGSAQAEAQFHAGTTAHCAHCGLGVSPGQPRCPGCGATIEDPSDRDVYDVILAPQLTRARNWILGVGGLYALSGLVMAAIYFASDPLVAAITLGLNLTLAVVHVGLFFWAKHDPFAAAVTALALFLLVHLTNAVLDPSTIAKGLCLKVIFVMVLGGAVKAGLDARRLRLNR